MASPIITPMPVQTDTNYRPVSRLAVVGLLASLLCPLIFISENLYWVLLAICVPSFILCLMAWRTIRQSEGNLAGESIALLGIVISVATGLGWMTMSLVTKIVTEAEAKAAVFEWIEKLQHNEPGMAFLLTNAPKYRNLGFNPEDYSKLRKQFPGEQQQTSAFDGFLVEPICGQILRYGDRVKLNFAGLIEAQTTRESPQYRFRYEMDSPIAKGSFLVTTRGEDYLTEEGIRRGWKMSVDANASYLVDTPYGEELRFLIKRATEEVDALRIDIASDEMTKAVERFDPKNQGQMDIVLGYIRPKGRKGIITPMGLLSPMRLRKDSKSGSTWTLEFDCTITAENQRAIDFSVVFVTSDPEYKKCTLQDCRFLGMRKIQAPTTGPGADLLRKGPQGQNLPPLGGGVPPQPPGK